MTAIDAAPAIAAPRPLKDTLTAGSVTAAVVDHAAVLTAITVWALPLTRASGGRGAHNELVYSAVAVAAMLVLRPWRVGRASSVLAATVAVAALTVCAVTPTGWSGSDVAASYVISAATFVIIRAYCTTSPRRLLVLAGVALASLLQFSEAFLPWWGGRDPAAEMTGTFYWHNPFAAFLVPGAVLGLGFAHANERPWRFVGWIGAPLCVAGVVFSTSRATLAVLALAWVAVAGVVVRSRRGALRVVAVTLLSVVVVLALPGPPFFSHRASPLAATSARAATGETLEQNGFYRTEFWRESLQVTAHNPVAGAGYHALATASALYTPVGWARSQLAHNGYLQPLNDGGVLLGAPFLLAVALAGVRALRTVGAATLSRARSGGEPQVAIAGVTLLALMAHSAVDFDWSHPSLLISAAMLAGVLFSAADREPGERRLVIVVRRAAPFAIAALAAALCLNVASLHAWQRAATTSSNETVAARLSAAGGVFGDFRPAKSVLLQAIDRPASVTNAEARRAVAVTADAARVDYHLRLWRDAVIARLGGATASVADARELVEGLDGTSAPYVFDYARVLAAAGDRSTAATVLTTELQRQAAGGPSPDGPEELQLLATVDSAADYSCAYQQLSSLILQGHWESAAPAPTRPCEGDG